MYYFFCSIHSLTRAFMFLFFSFLACVGACVFVTSQGPVSKPSLVKDKKDKNAPCQKW